MSLQTDASGSAITGMLNEYDGFSILRPVNIYPQNCYTAEVTYDMHDQELLAIVETLR